MRNDRKERKRVSVNARLIKGLWKVLKLHQFTKVQSYEWLSLSKVKKIAEEFLAKYPTLFTADFDANKKALDQLAIIPNRALRNQIAGAITKKVAAESDEKSVSASVEEQTFDESPQPSEVPTTEAVTQEA